MILNMSKYKEYTPITVTVPNDLLAWIDTKVAAGEFATRSHAFKFALIKLRENDKSSQ